MRQIERFDIYGPGAAGWGEPQAPDDVPNDWTGHTTSTSRESSTTT